MRSKQGPCLAGLPTASSTSFLRTAGASGEPRVAGAHESFLEMVLLCAISVVPLSVNNVEDHWIWVKDEA